MWENVYWFSVVLELVLFVFIALVPVIRCFFKKQKTLKVKKVELIIIAILIIIQIPQIVLETLIPIGTWWLSLFFASIWSMALNAKLDLYKLEKIRISEKQEECKVIAYDFKNKKHKGS